VKVEEIGHKNKILAGKCLGKSAWKNWASNDNIKTDGDKMV
jgi:hypothetical protein